MQKLDFDPYDFKVEEVEGVKIYYKEIPLVPCIHVRWSIGYGAERDAIGKEGTAHFLEHILFDGNPILKHKTDYDNFSRKYMLDTLNAYTSFNTTVLTCKFLPKNQDICLEAIYNIVYKPFIREEDIEHERKVITQEVWGRLYNQTHIDYLKSYKDIVFADLPSYHRMANAGGWPDTVAIIQKEDLENTHKYYTKENTHIILTGAISEEFIQKVSEIIKQIPNGEKLAEIEIPAVIKPFKQKRWTKTYVEIGLSDKTQSAIDIYRPLQKCNATIAVLIATSDLLGYLLHQKLRIENSWCYSVSSNFSLKVEFITQNIYVNVAPENVDDAEKIIWQTVDDIIAGKHFEDFETGKQTAIDSVLARERLSGNIADNAEDLLLINKKIETLEEEINDGEKVQYEDVIEHLRNNFKKEDVFTEIVVPTEVAKA